MKYLFIIISLALFNNLTQAQLGPIAELTRNTRIGFNEKGQMVEFPSTYINNNGRLCYRVTIPKITFSASTRAVRNMVEAAYQYFQQEEISCSYKSIFSDSLFNAIDQAYLEILNLLTVDSCLLKPIPNASLSKIEPFFPIMILQNALKNQYKVLVFSNDQCIDTIHLKINGHCGDNCIEFSDCSPKKIRDLDCSECEKNSSKTVEYRLIYDDPLANTIRTWVAEKSAAYYQSFGIEELQAQFNSFMHEDQKSPLSQQQLNELRPLGIWLSYWLWLNNGKLIVDPLKQRDKKKSEQILKEISDIEFEKSVLDDVQKILQNRKDTLVRKANGIHSIVKLSIQIREIKASINRKIERLKQLAAEYQSGYHFRELLEKKVRYRGYIKASQNITAVFNRQLYPTIQLDARNKYQPIPLNFWERRKIKAIPEDEWMHLAIHNMPESHAILQFAEKALPLDDTEEFTKLLMEALKQLQSIRALFADAEVQLFETLAAQGIVGTKSLPDSLNTPKLDVCDYSLPMLTSTYENWRILGFALPFQKPDDNKISYSTAAFQTQLLPTSPADAPYRDSVSVKMKIGNDTLLLPPIKFNVGKLRIVQFAAGIAFNKSPANTTQVDTAGNGFRVSTSDNRSRVLVAAKIYPFRQFNLDHGFIPRYPLRRLSIFAGFEMIKPLRNFYIGGAYDLVPGLSFSTGVNYYQQTRYQIENNTITNTSRTYQKSGQYYAITVNPVLFAQFIKLFIKSI